MYGLVGQEHAVTTKSSIMLGGDCGECWAKSGGAFTSHTLVGSGSEDGGWHEQAQSEAELPGAGLAQTRARRAAGSGQVHLWAGCGGGRGGARSRCGGC